MDTLTGNHPATEDTTEQGAAVDAGATEHIEDTQGTDAEEQDGGRLGVGA